MHQTILQTTSLRFVICASAAFMLAGCSTVGGLTTGSLLSGQTKKVAAPVDRNTPSARALQVGSAAARAIKCGYNFNPANLRANFLAAEAAGGLSVADLGKVERIYDTGFSGTQKAISGATGYCTAEKTTTIKTDLQRHLAGDYTPSNRKVAKADDGFFSNWGDALPDQGPAFGSEAWWENQRANAENN